jgi:hypothetical protein
MRVQHRGSPARPPAGGLDRERYPRENAHRTNRLRSMFWCGDFATNPECIWSREGGIRSRSRSDPIIVDLSTPLVYVARLGRTTRLSP